MTLAWTPLLIIMFLLTGQANALVSMHMEELKTWVAGGKGILGAVFAGMVTPGSLTMAPIVRQLWEEGMSRSFLLVYFVSASLLNIQIIMFRAPMFGKAATIGTTIAGAVLGVIFAICTALFVRFGRP